MDYNWLIEFKKTYSVSKPQIQQSVQTFIPLSLEEETPKQTTWEVKVLQLQSPDGDSIEIKNNNLYAVSELLRTEQEIGRFNVPKNDPMCSKHPQSIIQGNPVMPSLASFYLNSKFGYSLSENRIIDMLTESGADIPQSTLNKWMHEIMALMRERLQSRMLEVVKLSYFTQNDE